MGKGGLNRLLLTNADCIGADPHATGYELPADDHRAIHIRTLLAYAPTFTLRVAVEPMTLHDAAVATILSNDKIRILIPHSTARIAPPPPPVALIVAMQRPKVIGRVLEAAAAVGVSIICIVAADKVEKSYWDCKLFRDNDENENETIQKHRKKNNIDNTKQENNGNEVIVKELLPGRPRGILNHPHRDDIEISSTFFIRRVDQVPAVRRRLREAVQQANADATLPIVLLERRGLTAILKNASHPIWNHVPINATRVVAHPYPVDNAPLDAISRVVSHGEQQAAVLAIGPEGGWVENELKLFAASSFTFSSLGQRVLRSETATIISLGLVHEGLRLRGDNKTTTS